ncbi:MAG: hypothetical protein ABIH20_05370, partial [Candidatus Diapherotrites archaeon]
MALDLFSDDTEKLLTGILLIVLATVLLLSGLNLLFDFTYFFSQELDIVLAFIAIIIGITLI